MLNCLLVQSDEITGCKAKAEQNSPLPQIDRRAKTSFEIDRSFSSEILEGEAFRADYSPLMHCRCVRVRHEATAAAGFVHAGAADCDPLF